MGCNEIPNTTVKPSHYRIEGLNTLIDWVVHTYQPEKNEPVIVR